MNCDELNRLYINPINAGSDHHSYRKIEAQISPNKKNKNQLNKLKYKYHKHCINRRIVTGETSDNNNSEPVKMLSNETQDIRGKSFYKTECIMEES